MTDEEISKEFEELIDFQRKIIDRYKDKLIKGTPIANLYQQLEISLMVYDNHTLYNKYTGSK